MKRFLKRVLPVFLALSLAGQGCTNIPSAATQKAAQPVTLNVWGTVDDLEVYNQVFTDYRALHPNVTFIYKRFRLEEYESELLNALAEDRGPDIFMIHNDWTGKYMTKITPMPSTTKTAYRVLSGNAIQKTPTWELRTESTMSISDFKNSFADVVQNDILRTVNISTNSDQKNFQQRPMGIPLGIDTMALYYNKDLLNAAGIPTPPTNWTQFAEQVKKLTKLDTIGKVVQSAAGIGTADNVERSSDLLSILMIQNGQTMTDDSGYPQLNKIPAELSSRSVPPSYQALEFYTDFANPNKETYTWNSTFPNSLDAFIQGRTAFFFGYSYQYDTIRSRAPKLNLGISSLPQIEGNPTKNIANYWYFAVAKKSANQDLAWSFLNYMAKADESKKALDIAKVPAARKSLLSGQLDDERVGVFASQVLTATSWYRGVDPKTMENALKQMITDVVTNSREVNDAVRYANDTISQTIQ